MPTGVLEKPLQEFDELRNQALRDLREVMSAENYAGAVRCAVRLHAELPDKSQLERNVVLVAYGGGKDSSYTLAFVRAMQLILSQIHGSTFRMRVATNRHAGMPRAVMENIDRAYRALDLFGDPECELLLIDGRQIKTFDVDEPQAADVIQRNRLDILMTGHRTAGDARPTFCNACNLSMVNSFGLAAGHDGGVDLIITGDSREEQRDYYLWVSRLARKFGLQPEPGERRGFKGFLSALNNISQAYFTDIHGDATSDLVAEHAITTDVRTGLQFFSIYDDTAYASGDHWELLTQFLQFTFDDLAFSFTESDCGNPALMAHLRALKAERCHGRTYAEGLGEYVEFAVSLMHKKEFPPQLVALVRERYDGEGGAERMRAAMDAYALDAYGLTEEHLVTMVHAPFTEKGVRLEQFLRAEQPGLVADDVHALLGGARADAALAADLERISGLTVDQLQVLYGSSLRLPTLIPGSGELIDSILDGDPHKQVIQTRHTADGPVVAELISGR
ncbi:PqqD family protein [Streptomyces sp. SPB162]|uniref:PqqD family protein n=1 Tax=Streptomyces sp. SPB162 TaxID=2940560 RepID=UPI002405961D|nr:PqqD family protein [Streptomyces sp. SPB162]MDF9817046.1 3'-phosphoadenosine 5'-phosphosulfate sulfotransferase (PAPS reductase)/FAD synthetase [Streptomyces sp. SPB162]